jgi:hypothetical protein
MTVDESASSYTIRCEGAVPGQAGGITKATLTLSRSDMRVVAQVLTVSRNGRAREFRFDERKMSRLPSRPGGSDPFTPDTDLAQPIRPRDTRAGTPGGALEPLSQDEIAELEIEALFILNRVEATLGEQVSVSGGNAGVRIDAIVSSPDRKRTILGALAPLMGRRAVVVDVKTIHEAAQQRSGPRTSVTVQEVVPQRDQVAFYPDLLRYFIDHPDPSWPTDAGRREERVNREIVEFGARVLDRSRRAMQRAFALEHLATLVPPEAAARLGETARDRWRSMIREHAAAFLQETADLGVELAPMFGRPAGGAPRSDLSRPGDGGIAETIRAIVRLAKAQDDAVRSAFAVQAGAATPMPSLRAASFWDGLRRAASLARSLTDVP